jgi:hypothetical protein
MCSERSRPRPVYLLIADIQLRIVRALSRCGRIQDDSFKVPTAESTVGDPAAFNLGMLGGQTERCFFSSFDDLIAARSSESSSVPRMSIFGMRQ